MKVEIEAKELQRLLDDSSLLNLLRRYGVDNWEGWGVWYDEDVEPETFTINDILKKYKEVKEER